MSMPLPKTKTDLETTEETRAQPLLMWQFLRALIWLDRGLQQNLVARGWPNVPRTESQVMILLAVGINRPIDIARSLGLTRQAINQTLNQLVEKKLVKLENDPDDRRCKIVRYAEEGEAMRLDALEIMAELERELGRRGGRSALECLRRMNKWEWSDPPMV